ncbi:hypothetical protein [Undibacterium griseum]|uniref:Uncharacterized protein n=1 Tax=Undibacterium griseum TaxID=2762295 RepID=A0ABR6YQ64_9BURK|nr:hypothetical protein [Undibacterium griseum]MBC3886051.1 hypothetical protein [Undibacterium griseum]
MNRQFWKQFVIALVLFLLGYFTFNSKLFAAERVQPAAVRTSQDGH